MLLQRLGPLGPFRQACTCGNRGRDAARQPLPLPPPVNPHSRACQPGHQQCPPPATVQSLIMHVQTPSEVLKYVLACLHMWDTGLAVQLSTKLARASCPALHTHSTPCQPLHCPHPSPATTQSHIIHVYTLSEAFGSVWAGPHMWKTGFAALLSTPWSDPLLSLRTHSAPCQAVHRPHPSPETMKSQSMHAYTLSEVFWSVLVVRYRQGTSPSMAVTSRT